VIGPDSIADRSGLFPPNFESHLENPTRVSVDRRSTGRRVDRDAARARDGDAPGAVPSPAALAARGGAAFAQIF